MLAVGIWGAQLGAPAIWMLPVTFPMVMAFGGFLGLVGFGLPGVEVGIALSAVALGLVVAREARLPLAWAAVLVGFFAVFHGTRTARSCRPDRAASPTASGSSWPPAACTLVGILIGVVHKWQRGRTR